MRTDVALMPLFLIYHHLYLSSSISIIIYHPVQFSDYPSTANSLAQPIGKTRTQTSSSFVHRTTLIAT
ncbi:hypothetical protein BDN71DRAFT_1452924 [Pleurotus eryngii]|uniref:Uncharacterized protein n=1 Tax=Pleurotus eryngii TaxID=5323 RepID=A0A9P5ZPX5_PLEER|nr:hypothetical protein BDN71DRAFT_1452924 [Pleurotus eryngii]